MGITSFTKPRFLLCEGDDDKHFFEALIAERGLPDFQVCHSAECCGIGGVTGFARALKGMEVLAGWRRVRAILIATDNDAQSSFGAVRHCLTDNGYEAPSSPTTLGNMAGKPVAIRMVPCADMIGDLETLCLPAIYDKWPKARVCVPFFLRCSGALGWAGRAKWAKRSSVSKARARAATVGFNEADPYKGIGYLFKERTLSTAHRCFDDVATFLRNFDSICGI